MTKNKLLHVLSLYLPVTLFIIGWWGLAFYEQKPKQIPTISQRPVDHQHLEHACLITKVNRIKLHEALSGNVEIMANLIIDWDIDAHLLAASGVTNIKYLSQKNLLRSHQISRWLSHMHEEQISPRQILQNPFSANEARLLSKLDLFEKEELSVKNAKHNRSNEQIAFQKRPIMDQKLAQLQHYKKFLPQTYIAANFLLALKPPHTICALPKSLRKQTQLSPKSLTDQVPLDNDRYNAEKIFLENPEIAFVSEYSHPATIETLINQNVAIYTMKNPSSIEAIMAELIQIGLLVNSPLKSALLAIFMEASLIKFDNELTGLKHKFQMEKALALPKILFLNHYNYFSIPTTKNLTGQLLQRLHGFDISLDYVERSNQMHEWMVPIDKEKILKLNPDLLIIATDHAHALKIEMENDPAYKQLKAIQQQKVYFVDEATQQSPSQYIVLAYYDLIQPLLEIP